MEGVKLFTTQEVAAQLGVSDSLIRKMVSGGKLAPAAHYGRFMVFTQEQIEQLRSRPKRAGRPKKK